MPDFNPRLVAYRLWRLRRLIIVSALLPLPGILFASLFGFGLGFGGGGGALWLLWILITFTLAIRFPNGWMDHFTLGLPLLLIIALSPIARIVGVGPIGGIPLGLLILGAGWLFASGALPAMLDDIPLGTRKNAFSARIAIPASTFREAVFLRPNGTHGLHACGPANAAGIFEVRALGYRLPDCPGGDDLPDITFYAKVVESDATSQVTQFFLDEGDGSAGTVYEEVTPNQRGCHYAKEEVHDHFSALAAIGFWLNDAEADHLTAILDHIQDKPVRALKLMPQDGLLTWVAEQVMNLMSRDPA